MSSEQLRACEGISVERAKVGDVPEDIGKGVAELVELTGIELVRGRTDGRATQLRVETAEEGEATRPEIPAMG